MPIASRKVSKNSKSRCDGRSASWTISRTASRLISAIRSTKRNKKLPISAKMFSRHYSENKMHRVAKVSLAIFFICTLAPAQKREYFTEDELDLIRDNQDLNARVATYFKLAERRLIFLGIMEKSQQQIEKERKELDKRAKEQKKSIDNRANANKAPI